MARPTRLLVGRALLASSTIAKGMLPVPFSVLDVGEGGGLKHGMYLSMSSVVAFTSVPRES